MKFLIMRINPALILSLLVGFGAIQAAEAKQTEESFEPADGSQGYRYLLHLPKGAKNGKKK